MVTNKTPLLEITLLAMMTMASFYFTVAVANAMMLTHEAITAESLIY